MRKRTSLFSMVLLSIITAATDAGSARADFIVTDWTSFTSSSATGTLGGATITGTILSGAPFVGVGIGSFAPPVWEAEEPLTPAAEGISLQPVNPGADHIFTFSNPFPYVRFYIDNFDSASDAIITVDGASSVSLLGASSPLTYTPLSTTSGRLVTSYNGFNNHGSAVFEILGAVHSVRLQYTGGIQDNGITYTFAISAIPEPTSLISVGLGLVSLTGYATHRRFRSTTNES